MEVTDCKEGLKVRGANMFGLTYEVVKVNKSTVWVSHKTGKKCMRGGKLIDEEFIYENVKPSTLRIA